MKKAFTIIAVAAAMLATGTANAQLGINIGYAPVTLTTQTTSGSTTNTTTDDMTGFFAGANYNYSFGKDLALSFGLQARYNTKTTTGTVNLLVASGSEKRTATQLLLDVPVLVNYGLNLGKDIKLAVFAGPMLSYALYGNTHVTTTTTLLNNTSTSEKDYAMYGANSDNERLDLSAAFGLAFQYTQFRLFGGYRLGLLDLNSSDNVKTTTSGLFVGLGYAL